MTEYVEVPMETVNEILISAASSGSVEEVRACLKAGADVNYAAELKTGPLPGPYTALFNAAGYGHVDVAKLLLRKGACIVRRCTGQEWSPLHAAAVGGNAEMVDVLVRHGATVDIQDRCLITPITWACYHGNVDIVRQLIGFGARVDLMLDQKGRFKVEEPIRNTRKLEGLKLAREARKTRLLRCCNPKCSKPGYRSDLKLCAGCKLTRYCSRECQRQHWSGGHKTCCGQDEYHARCPSPPKVVFTDPKMQH